MKFSTTIKKVWWLLKILDFKKWGFFYEYKNDTEFWSKRLMKLRQQIEQTGEPVEGVFLLGSKPRRVLVHEICSNVLLNNVPIPYREAMETPLIWRLKCTLVKEAYGECKHFYKLFDQTPTFRSCKLDDDVEATEMTCETCDEWMEEIWG